VTDTEIKSIQFLDWLYDYRPDQSGGMAPVIEFVGEPDEREQSVWRGIFRKLNDDGLITFSDAMGFDGYHAMIAGPGRAEIEARRARRSHAGLRRSAARDAVVRWLYARPGYEAADLKPMLSDTTCYFECFPFERSELDAALVYLADKGIATGIRLSRALLTRPRLTDKGEDCVEQFGGSVRDYVRRGEMSGTQHTVNFHGPVSGSNVAWDNQTVTQTATTTSGVVGEELAVLVRAIVEAIPAMGLSEEDANGVQRNAAIIEGELAADQPDQGVVKRVMGRMLDTVGGVTDSALAQVLTAYAKEFLKSQGLWTE
jgi:hypothetical protein